MRRRRGELFLLLVFIGCVGERRADDDDFADGDADADADGDADPHDCSNAPPMPPLTPARGQVTVDFGYGSSVTGPFLSAQAKFFATDPPVTHEELMREGDCVLLAVSCEGSSCADPPLLSAGVVELSQGAESYVLDSTDGDYYGYFNVSPLDTRPAALEASGADVPAFSVEAPLPEDLYYVPNAALLQIRDQEDAQITWDAAFRCDSRVRLTLRSDGAAEGSPSDRIIVCDVPDQGHLEIPREIIQSYPEQHRASDYVSSLSRYTYVTVTAGDLDVEYRVLSQESFAVEHRIN